jgi:hypothetical protein
MFVRSLEVVASVWCKRGSTLELFLACGDPPVVLKCSLVAFHHTDDNLDFNLSSCKSPKRAALAGILLS